MERDVKQPDYLGHRQRLRQRFLLGEGKDMADYELLELVLTMAIPRRDVKPLAKKLITEFNDFSGVINAPAAALLEVDGVKENTLAMLKVIKAAAIRTSWQTLCAAEAPVIRSPDTLLEYCRAAMCHSDVEELRIIFMDAKLQVIGEETMQRGTINAVAVHPREVVKSALAHHASSIIMVHNHPSGNTTPSRADLEMTKKVEEACAAVGVKLHDHFVVSRSSHYSFREQGFIKL